jgi:hypothetical protein
MIKAYPWDRYVLPLVVVFWYLKSIKFQEQSVGWARLKDNIDA